MAAPNTVTEPKKTGVSGPRWMTVPELHGYIRDTYGVSLFDLKGKNTTFQIWAKKVGVRRRAFRYRELTDKAQRSRVSMVELHRRPGGPYLNPATALKQCRYEFNVSDIAKHARALAAANAKAVAKEVDAAATKKD